VKVERATSWEAECPECGGIAIVKRNGDWRCTAHDRFASRPGAREVEILVCAARGVTLGDDLVVTQGSNGIWRALQ